MKLLAKRDIDIQKSLDRQREIDEGVKLSRRVDALRRTQVEEEASLERFRAASVSKIHEEILRESNVRDALHTEVVRLEARREEALRPLDREMQLIATEKKELSEIGDVLFSRQAAIEKRETELALLERSVRDEEQRAKAMSREVADTLADAQEQKESALIAHTAAKRTLESVQTFKEVMEREIKERDAVCAARERDVSIREEWLASDREALELEKAQTADLRATLERAIKRLKK